MGFARVPATRSRREDASQVERTVSSGLRRTALRHTCWIQALSGRAATAVLLPGVSRGSSHARSRLVCPRDLAVDGVERRSVSTLGRTVRGRSTTLAIDRTVRCRFDPSRSRTTVFEGPAATVGVMNMAVSTGVEGFGPVLTEPCADRVSRDGEAARRDPQSRLRVLLLPLQGSARVSTPSPAAPSLRSDSHMNDATQAEKNGRWTEKAGEHFDVLLAACLFVDWAQKAYDAIMQLAEDEKIKVEAVVLASRDHACAKSQSGFYRYTVLGPTHRSSGRIVSCPCRVSEKVRQVTRL